MAVISVTWNLFSCAPISSRCHSRFSVVFWFLQWTLEIHHFLIHLCFYLIVWKLALLR